MERLPSLDGWRALCLIMVLASHSTNLSGFEAIPAWVIQIPIFFDGHLAVRFFFVISGFLITYLLVKEREKNGYIHLKSFYIRRSLRILPVYFAYLIVVAIFQYRAVITQSLLTWIGDITFTVNFLPRSHVSGHLWSLSVEEQFYLLWPLTLLWLYRHPQQPRWILAAPFALAFFCNFISFTDLSPWLLHPLFHHHSSLVNFDALGIGCLAAFAMTRREGLTRHLLGGNKGLCAILVAVGLIIIPTLDLQMLPPASKILTPSLQTVGFSILLLSSVLNPRWFKPWNWPILTHLGVVSYSVYIWQQLFWVIPAESGLASQWWASFPGWLAPALGAGFISYYGLERPLLSLRKRFRWA